MHSIRTALASSLLLIASCTAHAQEKQDPKPQETAAAKAKVDATVEQLKARLKRMDDYLVNMQAQRQQDIKATTDKVDATAAMAAQAADATKAQAQLKTLQSELDTQRARGADMQRRLADFEQQLAATTASASEKQSALQQQLAAAVQSSTDAAAKAVNLEQQLAEAQNALATANANASERLTAMEEQSQATAAAENGAVAALRTRFATESKNQRVEAQQREQELTAQLATTRAQLEQQKSELAEILAKQKQATDTAMMRADEIAVAAAVARSKADQANQALAVATAEADEMKAMLDGLQRERHAAVRERNAAEAQLEKHVASMDKLRAQSQADLDRANDQLHDAQARNEALTTEIESLRAEADAMAHQAAATPTRAGGGIGRMALNTASGGAADVRDLERMVMMRRIEELEAKLARGHAAPAPATLPEPAHSHGEQGAPAAAAPPSIRIDNRDGGTININFGAGGSLQLGAPPAEASPAVTPLPVDRPARGRSVGTADTTDRIRVPALDIGATGQEWPSEESAPAMIPIKRVN